ncbi:MAG: MarR family winged helix-turn-helix transcriptional regulator [Candidatus Limnocylindrales bacterium]
MDYLNESNDRYARIAEAYERMALKAASFHASEFVELDLTMSQAKALYVARAAGELRISELAAQLGVGVSTVSALVDRLVDQNLLRRHVDPSDRRHVYVSITPEGSARLDRLRELSVAQLRTLLERLSGEELAIIEQALAILTEAGDR